MKFGGTSVGSPAMIKEVAKLISDEQPKIVVLSAMAGTTNDLILYAGALHKQERVAARKILDRLLNRYLNLVNDLFKTATFRQKGIEMIESHFTYLRGFNRDMFTIHEEKAVLAQGELILTALMQFYLEECKIPSVLISALDFMRIDKDLEPDHYYIRENLNRQLTEHQSTRLFLTQGFICRNVFGEIDNLKRGGSDYTASLIGAALGSEEIQIWTDIDGVHHNDPRFVPNTRRIDHLSFDEAAELAYFGAKILHPTSIHPAREKKIPVRLKNTLDPTSPGTLITSESSGPGIKAVAAKDGITAIRIQSDRMLLAYGFLRKVFEIFETHRTPIDMITTSEVSVSVTVDFKANIEHIVKDLTRFGSVEVSNDRTIICVVGDQISESTGLIERVLNALKTIQIRMISFGSSHNNISLLVKSKDKVEALNLLSEHLFKNT